MTEPRSLFNEECQLVAWGDSNTSGPWIKLRLTDPEQLAPFRGMTLAKGDHAGQLLRVVIFEHEADPQPEVGEKPKGGPLAKLAGLWCESSQFQSWLALTYNLTWVNAECDEGDDVARAADCVRTLCRVRSRAEIDHDEKAKAKFDRWVREPYRAFLEGRRV